MTSWRTSVIGVVLIVGALASLAISAAVNRRAPGADELMFAGGTIATGIGLIQARDNNKSSEDVGAK
jgi:drug/metabolite transporter (DMT)-like permease